MFCYSYFDAGFSDTDTKGISGEIRPIGIKNISVKLNLLKSKLEVSRFVWIILEYY